MFDIILCSGVSRSNFDIKPLGMYKIASALRNNGYRVKTLDMFSSMTMEQFKLIIDNYISETTILIGVSASLLKNYETNDYFGIPVDELVERFEYIRTKNKNIKFVLGGAQISNTENSILNTFTMFDYVVKGQGEECILHIASHIKSNSKLTINTITKPYIVTDITYPYTTFNSAGITFHIDDNIQPGECLPLEIARGCVFKCKFCSYDLTNKDFFEFTKHENLIREEILYNYNNFKTQYYVIADDLINDSEEKIDMLLRITKSLPFKIFISGYIRLDLLWRFPSMIDKLKEIGLIGAFMGIETINDNSGRIVGKGLGRKRIEETLEMLYAKWNNVVHITAAFILGLPKDNKETASELISWCRDKLTSSRLHCVHIQPLSINKSLGKADIDKNPEKYGYELLESNIEAKHRYSTLSTNWKTESYDFKTAVNECKSFYISLDKYNVAVIHAFNLTNIRSFNDSEIDKSLSNLMNNINYDRSILLSNIKTYHLNNKEVYIRSLIIGQ